MPFTVAVVYFSRHGRLVTLANVVAEGARSVRIEIFSPFVFCRPTLLDQPLPLASLLSKKQVPGADVEVYRVPDPFSERAGAILESPRGQGAGGETAAAGTATEADEQQRASASSPPPLPPPLLSSSYDDGVLDAPVATRATLAVADVILLGAPARQGGMCGEMRLFLDSLAPAAEAGAGARGGTQKNNGGASNSGGQPPRTASPAPPTTATAISLRGKVGAAFTAIGGPARGPGGAESVLTSFHATFLSHGMVVVGAPPSPAMDGSPWSTPLGAVAASGGEASSSSLKTSKVASSGGGASSSSSSSAAAAAAAALASQHVSLSGTEVRLGYSLGQWAAQVGALLHGDDDGGGGCE